MDRQDELGRFLKSRRARLRPADVGLTAYGERRRVPGLRREELAQLAGVSVTHYTRLEQGRAHHVSAEIVDAIAGALRLTGEERAHLHRLVRPARRDGVAAPPVVRPGLRHLLDSLVLTPAVVIGHHTEIVAWNPLMNELVGLDVLPRERRTMSHWLFFGDAARSRMGDTWEAHARRNVAFLRTALARHPDDERLRGHVAVMRVQSTEFERLWQVHEVHEWVSGDVGELSLRHPDAGVLELSYERVLLPSDPGLSGLTLWTAPPGSPSHAALRRLAERLESAAP
ncbi:hypothetical protein BJF79_37585 [Actinomadura sp. CNU-125]|uniref:helix-turn-helix transcriptional regulator n=1 Tax=Actinomadura sp. CNU-125 TaxID=1904961 RepID=UPI0009602811|nr:helix-turn-helix transcriptional regulator [Actinomadura sp. CNU-125]OLT31084.1 hypothetical protein BJF79_37585 [Actinomadura sp. CNU-125]